MMWAVAGQTERITERFGTRQTGTALAAGAMFLVSTESLITRAAGADGWSVAFWYGVFAAPTMLVLGLAVERQSIVAIARRSGWPVLFSGLLQMGSTLGFILAVKNTAVSNVVVIVAASPVFAAVISWLVLRERTAVRTLVAIGISLVGIGLVVSGSLGGDGLLGDALALVAVLCFAVNLTLWRRYVDMSRFLAIGIGAAAMAIACVGVAQITGLSGRTYLLIAIMGIVTGPIARVALASAPKFLPVSQVSLFTPIETVLATLWAWLAFDETPAALTVVGGVLVVGAVIYGTRTRVPVTSGI